MLSYLKKLISNDPEARVSAFIAVLATFTLCIGFAIELILLFFGKAYPVYFITTATVLGALASFNKIDVQDVNKNITQNINNTNSGE